MAKPISAQQKNASNLSLLEEKWLEFLSQQDQPLTIFVGLSCGLDSTVLLHSLHKVVHANPDLCVSIQAIHINHQLQDLSADWVTHCQDFCKQLNIALIIKKVNIQNTGKGLEAAARQQRYRAFQEVLAAHSMHDSKAVLVTAHHQRDQVETSLLNLMRGAGVKGLAAMQAECELKIDKSLPAIWLCRPFLQIPYQALQDYAKKYALVFAEDPTNFDVRYRRNFVRHKLLPLMQTLWPQAQSVIAKTSENLQETNALLNDYAHQDLMTMVFTPVYIELNADESWASHNWARNKNILRYWLQNFWPEMSFNQAQFDWVKGALEHYAFSHNQNFSLQLAQGSLKVYKNRLYYLVKPPQSFTLKPRTLFELQRYLTHLEQVIRPLNLTGCSLFNPIFSFDLSDANPQDSFVLQSFDGVNNLTQQKKKLKQFYQQNSIPVWERPVWPVLTKPNSHMLQLAGCKECLQSAHKSTDKAVEQAERATQSQSCSLNLSYLAFLYLTQQMDLPV